MTKIYLASPYSDPSPAIRTYRYIMACKISGLLMLRGFNVFSPIALCHPISVHMKNSMDHDFWLNQVMSYLTDWADELYVATLPGYRDSRGIQLEIERAKELQLPVTLYTLNEDLPHVL